MMLKLQKEFIFTHSLKFRTTTALFSNQIRKQAFLGSVPRNRFNSDAISKLLKAHKKAIKNEPNTKIEQESIGEKVNSNLTNHMKKRGTPRTSSSSETLTKLINANKVDEKSGPNDNIDETPESGVLQNHRRTEYLSKLYAISKDSGTKSKKEFNTSKSSKKLQDVNLSRNLIKTNEAEKVPDAALIPKKQNISNHQGRYTMFYQTIDVFRNNPDKYPFIQLTPPPRTGGNRLVGDVEKENINKMFWLKFAARTGDKDDLLDAWQLVSKDTISSCSEVEKTIVDFFVQSLCKKLPSLSYQELSSVLFHLTLFYKDQAELRLLSSLLDQQLSTSLKRQLDKGFLSEEDISSYLRVGFIWLKLNMVSDQNLTSGIHNNVLVRALLTRHIDLLTPQQTVFALFLCGVQRRYPGCNDENSSGQGWPLPPLLAEKLEVVLNQVSHTEVGVVCHSLHLNNLYILTEHVVVRSTIIKNLIEFPTADIQKHELSITCFAKILKKRGSEHHTDVMKVMKKYRPHLKSLNSYTKIRLLQFIIPGKPLDTEEFLKDLCDSFEDDLCNMRVKDLDKLAFSLYFLGYKDSGSHNIYQKISEALYKCDWSNVRTGRNVVFLISHLARCGMYDLHLMDSIFEEVNKCHVDNLDTDQGLARAVNFILKLNVPAFQNMKATKLLNFIKGNRLLCRSALYNVVELDCIREMHQLKTENKLNPQIRSTVTEYFQRGKSSSDIILKHGKIDADNFGDQSRKFVYRDLSVILGGERFVRIEHVFPFSTFEDLFFALDRNGVPMDISRAKFPKSELLWRHKGDGWRAVVIPMKSLITWNGQPLGPVKYKINNLELFGYNPTVLHWPEYYKALREKKNYSFLRHKLKIKQINN